MPDEKRTGPVDWEDIRFFAALARLGSLSAVARAFRVNHATVSRRVTALERNLGVRLFERTATGYPLTPAGERFLSDATAMETAAAGFSGARGAAGISGRVRLTCTPSFASGFLLARLPRLRARYPALELEVLAEARALNVSHGEADLAVRLGRPRVSSLSGRKLTDLEFRVYGTSEVLQGATVERPPPVVTFDERNAHLPEALWLRERFPRPTIALCSNSQLLQAEAAARGLGVAVLPTFLASPPLVEWPPAGAPPPRELWLLGRPDWSRHPRLRAVADFLIDAFAAPRPG